MAVRAEHLSNPSSMVSNKGVVLDRVERKEYPFLTRDGNPRQRGAIKWAVFPQLQQGKDIFTISEATGLTPKQVRRARLHVEEMEELPYLSPEEKSEIKSKSLKGRPSHFKGHSHNLDSLVRLRESHLGRKLTEAEYAQTTYVHNARQIPGKAGMPSIHELYDRMSRKFPSGKKNEMYLEVEYAVEILELLIQSQEGASSYASRQQIEGVFAQLDPSVSRRMEPEILFIRSKVNERVVNQKAEQSKDVEEKAGMSQEQKDRAAAIFAQWENYIRTGAERFMTFNRMGIDDVISDAALRLLQNVDKIPDDPNEQMAFIFTFIKHAVVDYNRSLMSAKRDYRKTEPLDISNPTHHGSNRSAEETAMHRGDIKQIAPILNRYPYAKDYIISGDTIREVAMRSGVAEGTIKTQLHLLRERLKK